MADLKNLVLGGADGGNVVMAAVLGGPTAGNASWEFGEDYDPAEDVAVLPFLAAWTADSPPLVFLSPASAESAKSVPFPLGVVRVDVLDDDGNDVGQLHGVAVGFVTAPEAGEALGVSYRLDREQ